MPPVCLYRPWPLPSWESGKYVVPVIPTRRLASWSAAVKRWVQVKLRACARNRFLAQALKELEAINTHLLSLEWFDLLKVNGQSRDRTGDLRIFSPSLYQLSYLSSSPPAQKFHRLRRNVSPAAGTVWIRFKRTISEFILGKGRGPATAKNASYFIRDSRRRGYLVEDHCWRADGYPGATDTTRRLLDHWFSRKKTRDGKPANPARPAGNWMEPTPLPESRHPTAFSPRKQRPICRTACRSRCSFSTNARRR